MDRTQSLYRRAKEIIPGGTQLFSKRPELFSPGLWPAYFRRAKGCRVWDLDGREYTDMSYMGIGACILGYADEDVDRAVTAVIKAGTMSTLNAPEEVELAKTLLALHPWARLARFARTGGEAMAVAVRIARAATGKSTVLFSGYHGWHDWYLAANLASHRALDGHVLPGLSPAGVPRCLKGTAFPFVFNDCAGFLKLIKRYGRSTGAVVIESVRNAYPTPQFLRTVRQATAALKIPLIVDEITGGFRLNPAGAHLCFRLKPDMAVFAKGMSNGYPMAAVIGTARVMDCAQESFISSTYWTERIGPVAALATIKKIRDRRVCAHLAQTGKAVQQGWSGLAQRYGLRIRIGGIYPLGHFSFEYPDAALLKTVFTQHMLKQGYLATTAFYASLAHRPADVRGYLAAVDSTFGSIASALKRKRVGALLRGKVCSSGFKRLA